MQQNGIQRLTDAFDLDTSVVRQITLVEVLKGPAAALVARGEPSGTINLPSKQAELGRSFGTAAIQYGSWGRVRGEADANVSLTGGLTVRLIGYAEDADTFRDYVHHSHWAFLPSVGLAPGPDTRVACDFEKTGVAVPRNPALESLIAEVEAEIGRYGKLALVS